jgi:hypothetical protein
MFGIVYIGYNTSELHKIITFLTKVIVFTSLISRYDV